MKDLLIIFAFVIAGLAIGLSNSGKMAAEPAPDKIALKTSPRMSLTPPLGESKAFEVLLSGHKPNPETRRIHRELLASGKL